VFHPVSSASSGLYTNTFPSEALANRTVSQEEGRHLLHVFEKYQERLLRILQVSLEVFAAKLVSKRMITRDVSLEVTTSKDSLSNRASRLLLEVGNVLDLNPAKLYSFMDIFDEGVYGELITEMRSKSGDGVIDINVVCSHSHCVCGNVTLVQHCCYL